MSLNDLKKDKSLGVRMPHEVFDRLKAKADAQRRSVSNYLMLLIERDLDPSPSLFTDEEMRGSDARPYPVLSHSQAHALRDLIIASQKVAEEQIEYMLGEERDSNNTEN